jgi:hypothetical protein
MWKVWSSESGEIAGDMLQKFWDSALALEAPETDDDSHRLLFLVSDATCGIPSGLWLHSIYIAVVSDVAPWLLGMSFTMWWKGHCSLEMSLHPTSWLLT